MTQKYEPATLFLSYARANRETALRFKSDLQAGGIRVWIDDEGIPAGTPDWEKTIRSAIRSADAVLLLASPDAQESLYVRDEIRIAQDLYQRTVYPVWIEGKSWMACVPLGLGSIQYIDARQSNYSEAISALAAIFRGDGRSRSTQPKADRAEEPRNPYKGLQAFTESEAQDFFGRTALIDLLVARLKQALSADKQNTPRGRLLAIVGPSGSGKSSVVMAGLLPSLRRGDVLDSRAWMYLEPITPGEDPLGNLQATLAKQLPGGNPTVIREDLEREDAQGLYLYVQMLTQLRQTNVVLIIDQLEELFTLTTTEYERRQFINLLTNALTEPQGSLIVILTLRADFYDRPMRYAAFAQLLSAYQQVVLPMTLTELRAAIEAPAQKVGLTFEKDLVNDLLFEMVGQSNALPLLQFTLEQLFQHRNGRQLTCQSYQELGGIGGALRNQAEKTYNALPSEDQRHQAHSLFLRLISPGVTEQDATRRRAALTEISLPDAEQTRMILEVADTFVAARLLTMSEVAGIITIEVSHEAIIREWKRLSDWLFTSRSDILLQHSISKDAAEWIRYRKPADRLYRGSQLDEALAWANRNVPSRDEDDFLQACIRESEQQENDRLAQQARELDLQRRLTRRQRYVIGMIGGTSLIIIIALIAGIILQNNLFNSLPVSVTNLNDHGPGSLRSAITTTPSGGTITFLKTLEGVIKLTSGELKITKNLTISGPGNNALSLSGEHKSRVFNVSSGVVVTLSNLTITNGLAMQHASKIEDIGGDGGAIFNGGALALNHITIYDNIANASGGGVYNDLNASLTLAQSNVFQNTAHSGGGIDNVGSLTISASTIADNKAKAGGGGVSTVGQMILLSSTFSGNTASDGGSIEIFNDTEPARIVNCTISDNHVTGRGGGMEVSSGSHFLYLAYNTIYENGAEMGGGIYTDSPSIALAGNIIADNHAVTAADIQGTISSFFGNLIQDFNGVSLLMGASRVAQPITGVQPKIGPLQDNGGPTKTRALLPGSPAIDQIGVILFGSDTICGGNSDIITDQRGISRPQGKKCDLGAYEFVPSKK